MSNKDKYKTIAYWTAERLRAYFGSHFNWILTQEHPDILADCRAAGAWYANLLELEAAYRSLAAKIRAGEVSK